MVNRNPEYEIIWD